ncbi:MAG: hypothetical protein NWF09_08810 [Candidatus Bathyarchaeota archaeon]|nr:hypothetical protein [Candidatus Bathyarchaeota archaeon]
MSLSPIRFEILEAMLLLDKPEKPAVIAKEAGKDFPSAMMHILWLTRMGYAASPAKGLYVITENGKKALGLPDISREKAREILAPLPTDKAFHFYAGIGKPLNLSAHSLRDFCDKILNVDEVSINFHLNRGDFEAWFTCLGDVELAKKVALLKAKKNVGEDLRKRLHAIVETRCMALANVAAHAITSV